MTEYETAAAGSVARLKEKQAAEVWDLRNRLFSAEAYE
jgi:hypothetical protein